MAFSLKQKQLTHTVHIVFIYFTITYNKMAGGDQPCFAVHTLKLLATP